LETDVLLEDAWFHLEAPIGYGECDPPALVPQIWNERLHAKVVMSATCIKQTDSETDKECKIRGVYGGVKFGLHKFDFRGKVHRVGTPLSSQAALPASSVAKVSTRSRRLSTGAAAVHSAVMPLSTARSVGLGRLSSMGFSSSQPKLQLPGRMATLATSSIPIPETTKAPPVFSAGQVTPGALVPSKVAPQATTGKMSSVKASLDFQITRGFVQPVPEAKLNLVKGPMKPAKPEASYAEPMLPPGMRSGKLRFPEFAPPNAFVSAVSAPKLTDGPLSAAAAFGAPRLAAALYASIPHLPPTMPSLVGLPTTAEAARQLQGVDLRLDSFALSDAKRVASQGDSRDGDVKPLDECVAMGDAFWAGLEDESNGLFNDEDRSLLKSVFNPALSDRRTEGDAFCPPEASHPHVTNLRTLVKEEEVLRQQRTCVFFGKEFEMNAPGPMFPSSWSSSLSAVALGHLPVRDPNNQVTPRPDLKSHVTEALDLLTEGSSPVFDRTTEDGMHFRIYRLGSLEVRTVQEITSEEKVGAVFSIGPSLTSSKKEVFESVDETIPLDEKLITATEYVEHAEGSEKSRGSMRQYYLTMETQNGRKILTERLPDGTVRWDEDPMDLEERNSLARVTRVSECQQEVTVRDVKTYKENVAKGAAQAGHASPSVCKRYSRTAYNRAVGPESKRPGFPHHDWMKMAEKKSEASFGVHGEVLE
jgi:hypothetical protein